MAIGINVNAADCVIIDCKVIASDEQGIQASSGGAAVVLGCIVVEDKVKWPPPSIAAAARGYSGEAMEVLRQEHIRRILASPSLTADPPIPPTFNNSRFTTRARRLYKDEHHA